MMTGDAPPRVWVVQRRRVATSQWNFDPNPDTASFIAGMAVRPIIGIPWSEDNALTFADMNANTSFTVTMNTGASLRFDYTAQREVLRSETDIFRQVEPGLALLLIGEVDEEGMPTATRTLVTAAYAPDQELTRSGELVEQIAPPPVTVIPTDVPTALPTPVPFADVNVQIIRVTVSPSETNPRHVSAQLRLYNDGATSLVVTADDLWIAFGYVENPPGPRLPADGLAPFELLPGQAADVTLRWAWHDEPYASLGVGDWRFALEL
ncbi:MAG: hypothetical protein HC828_06140 [Blastochloris sp.]|nr:hypothetical protein [Blastochloris sp.]